MIALSLQLLEELDAFVASLRPSLEHIRFVGVKHTGPPGAMMPIRNLVASQPAIDRAFPQTDSRSNLDRGQPLLGQDVDLRKLIAPLGLSRRR